MDNIRVPDLLCTVSRPRRKRSVVEIQKEITGGTLKPDTDPATRPASSPETDAAEHTPPRTGRPALIQPSGIPSMQMLHIQGRKAIVRFIHFFDRRTRDLPDNRHPGAVRDRGWIEKLFLQGEEATFRLHAVGHRPLFII